jgi:type IV pilus assembly protein PilM
MKRIPLPKVTPKELADAINLEAEHHIPFAVDEVFLDYKVVGESVNSMSVVLVAVKKVKVLEYVAAVEQAGLEALVVDLDAFAIQNQFELNHPEPADEAVALIDIGATVMKTNVVRGGASVFARDVPFGGHNYTQAIAQRLNIPFEKAEAAKQGQDVGVAWEDDLVPALEAVSRDLLDGGAAHVRLLRVYRRVGADRPHRAVRRLRGWPGSTSSVLVLGRARRSSQALEHVEYDAAHSRPRSSTGAGPLLSVAVGLGLRRPGDKAHDQDQPGAASAKREWAFPFRP